MIKTAFGDKTFCLIMIFTIGWSSWTKEDHHHDHEEEEHNHDHGENKKDDVMLSPRQSARANVKDLKQSKISHVHGDGTIH